MVYMYVCFIWKAKVGKDGYTTCILLMLRLSQCCGKGVMHAPTSRESL